MTSVTYVATAGLRTYAIPFPFIREAHLSVLMDEVLVPTADWTVTGGDTLELDVSVSVLAGARIQITRATPTDELLVQFQAPTPIRRDELITLSNQLLFALQELSVTGGGGSGLPIDPTQTFWDAGTKVLKNLGAAVDADDAASKGYVDNQLAGEGILPEPVADDIGKGIRIRGGGGGGAIYTIGAVAGAFKVYQVPLQPTGGGALDPFGGYPLVNGGIGDIDWDGRPTTRMPLEEVAAFLEPDAGEISLDPNTFDILVPRGKFEVFVEGAVRNLTTGSGLNQFGVSGALTDDTGVTVFDMIPYLPLGYGVAHAGGFDPQALTVPISLYAYLDNANTQPMNLRLSGNGNVGETVASSPFRVFIREIPQ